MIKKILLLSALALFVFACGDEAENDANPSDTTEITVSEDVVEIVMADFETKAGNFIGKEVKVSGIVDHVCKHGGKKILLVDGDYSLHVYKDERFDEAIAGSKISVTGIVEEERVDSAFLAEELKHEEGSHGGDNEADEEHLEKVKEHIQLMMDSLKKEGVDHFSNYSLKYVSHSEEK